jgi:hypothetical protein
MPEKSFLEILTEKIEQRVRAETAQTTFSREEKVSNSQTVHQTQSEKTTQNVDNSSSNTQWISQIPVGKIHFSTPRDQIFGRVYPRNNPTPRKKAIPLPERKKHFLTEKQKQAVVYFWGWQIRLQEDFTAPELKKAFRTLAQRLHPDRNNGQTKAFIELKANYDCLATVF